MVVDVEGVDDDEIEIAELIKNDKMQHTIDEVDEVVLNNQNLEIDVNE